MTKMKNDPINYGYEDERTPYENVKGEPAYLPSHYAHRGYTDTFYNEDDESGVGSFLFGALVGGVIGAATALFLAPKTGKEMRDDFSTQANSLKDKSIELSAIAKDKASQYGSVAKDKASEFASTAKEKTDGVTKSLQQQSGQIVDKVKSLKNNKTIPMDDGTASSEGEEAIEFIDKVEDKLKDTIETTEEKTTQTAEALKDAVAKSNSSESNK